MGRHKQILVPLPPASAYTRNDLLEYAEKCVRHALRPVPPVEPHSLPLGDYLRRCRRLSRMTLMQVSSQVDISYSLLSNIENGYRGASSLTLVMAAGLARVYRVSIEELLEAAING